MEAPDAKRSRVHFGSLEEQEKKRLLQEKVNGEQKTGVSPAILAGIKAGNINISTKGGTDSAYELTKVPERRNDELLAEFERRKKVNSIVVPTDDAEVKARLRELKEPICLFGEGPMDRKLRLKSLVAEFAERGVKLEMVHVASNDLSALDDEESEVWYHEGVPKLLAARYWIASYSMPRARDRLKLAKEEAMKPGPEKAGRRQELNKKLRLLANSCSQIGDDRPIAYCQFSPDSKTLATASWSGLCKLWSIPDCELIRVLRGHNERAGAIVFHPEATKTLSPQAASMASCAADGSVCLWNMEQDTPIAELEGHAQRVSRLAYHPSGRFLGTACYDHSWRLWDLQTQTEIVHQEGHSRPVYNICFHPDGSLAGSSGLDGCARMWDLRSGKCIMLLDSHLKGVLAIDISPNGYHVCTGGDDHTIDVWDIRRRGRIYTVPAHTSLVSHLKFQNDKGDFIVTSSYDNTAKVWAHPGWTPLKTLAGHEGKVMCVDLSPDQQYIATSSYDRTFKLWEREQQ